MLFKDKAKKLSNEAEGHRRLVGEHNRKVGQKEERRFFMPRNHIPSISDQDKQSNKITDSNKGSFESKELNFLAENAKLLDINDKSKYNIEYFTILIGKDKDFLEGSLKRMIRNQISRKEFSSNEYRMKVIVDKNAKRIIEGNKGLTSLMKENKMDFIDISQLPLMVQSRAIHDVNQGKLKINLKELERNMEAEYESIKTIIDNSGPSMNELLPFASDSIRHMYALGSKPGKMLIKLEADSDAISLPSKELLNKMEYSPLVGFSSYQFTAIGNEQQYDTSDIGISGFNTDLVHKIYSNMFSRHGKILRDLKSKQVTLIDPSNMKKHIVNGIEAFFNPKFLDYKISVPECNKIIENIVSEERPLVGDYVDMRAARKTCTGHGYTLIPQNGYSVAKMSDFGVVGLRAGGVHTPIPKNMIEYNELTKYLDGKLDLSKNPNTLSNYAKLLKESIDVDRRTISAKTKKDLEECSKDLIETGYKYNNLPKHISDIKSHDYFSVGFGGREDFISLLLQNSIKSSRAVKSNYEQGAISFTIVTNDKFMEAIKRDEKLTSLYNKCIFQGIKFIPIRQINEMAKKSISDDILLQSKGDYNKKVRSTIDKMKKDMDANLDLVLALSDQDMNAFGSDIAKVIIVPALMNQRENHFVIKLEADAILNKYMSPEVDKLAKENDVVGTKYYGNNIPYSPRKMLFGKTIDKLCGIWDDVGIFVAQDKNPSQFYFGSLAKHADYINLLRTRSVKLYNDASDVRKFLDDKDSKVEYIEVPFYDALLKTGYKDKYFIGEEYNRKIGSRTPPHLTNKKLINEGIINNDYVRSTSLFFNSNLHLPENKNFKMDFGILSDFGVGSLLVRLHNHWDDKVNNRVAISTDTKCDNGNPFLKYLDDLEAIGNSANVSDLAVNSTILMYGGMALMGLAYGANNYYNKKARADKKAKLLKKHRRTIDMEEGKLDYSSSNPNSFTQSVEDDSGSRKNHRERLEEQRRNNKETKNHVL